jgi:hypothetical protein
MIYEYLEKLELISAIFMKGTSHQEIKIFPSQQKKKKISFSV